MLFNFSGYYLSQRDVVPIKKRIHKDACHSLRKPLRSLWSLWQSRFINHPNRTSALGAFGALLAIYAATLAPDVTYWDSGEFLAAIHSLGIPHPPGTPLYIIAANVWGHIFAPLLGFARAINLFSAACAAAGCALLANLFARWTRDPYAGFAAAICAGTTATLWASATETEVYAAAFLVAMLMLWIANEVRETMAFRYAILLAYVAGLGWALHLTALIVFPAALFLCTPLVKVTFTRRHSAILASLVAGLLGASAVLFMYLRAQHDPAINQGNPNNFGALIDVIARKQYGYVSVFSRQAPLYLQFGNLFEWADWQFALGLNSRQPPGLVRTPITVIFALLGCYGFLEHRRVHAVSWRALTVLFLSATVGVILYLNLKAGPSYGIGVLGADAPHEARERDYFFILAWVCWGVWAGLGAVKVARRTLKSPAYAVPLGLAIAASPAAMNWTAADRSSGLKATEAHELAAAILSAAPRNAVVLAHGDNDTYPVWYEREVREARPDIVSLTIPMLPTRWYREEIERRYDLLDRRSVTTWLGTEATVRVICDRAIKASRPVTGPFDPSTRAFTEACVSP